VERGAGMKKSKLAVLTHVRDEKDMLPLWLAHYKKHVPKESLYVIDHDSVDGSTEGLDVEVIKASNGGEACESFKTRNIMDIQSQLLEKYEYVLYVDADEFVFPSDKYTDLVDFINQNDEEVYVFKAWEPIEVEGEVPIDWTSKLMKQRKKGVWHDIICKPALSRIPLLWCDGQHHSNQQMGGFSNAREDLFMIHLHRIDKQKNMERHAMRSSAKYSATNEERNYCNHWKKIKGKEFDEWYYDLKGEPLLDTPEYFKVVL